MTNENKQYRIQNIGKNFALPNSQKISDDIKIDGKACQVCGDLPTCFLFNQN